MSIPAPGAGPSAPPGHQPWQGTGFPGAAPATPAATQGPGVWSAPPPQVLPPYGQGPRGDRTALWLAGSALALAVVAVALSAVAMFMTIGWAGPGAFPPPYALSGEVVGVAPGSFVSGDRIEHAVSNALADDGADVGDIACDDLMSSRSGIRVTCRGTVDGFDDWIGTVQFETDQGDFTLYEE